ncbi:MAG TPA: 3-hydroxyacyl-CoA dehydrogenase NAD-binding domain-containing protein [Polyangiaceae bacterium]|jgi:3-hydroxybutyryl-CoA dehydrogenase|nr:3-hydroxyacyl-CoA dehydrogenase NAD-binding domain-containing protein [Polyangiaceae bacterium]
MNDTPVVGVVGAGQMGRGIAQVAAQSGCEVHLMDTNETQVNGALVSIAKDLNRLVSKGKLGDGESAKILERIRPTRVFGDLAACEYVIEAAVENTELKLQIFRDMDKTIAPQAILASNTSSISLTKLAGVTKRPERVIGMHFMNPVPLMKLVEIVRALQTADDTYQETCKLSQKLGKTFVTTRDMPGFIVNRMLIPFINEACFTLQDGLGTVADIDEAARLGLNHPMGPLQLADLIGLDTCLFITEVLQREFGEDKYRPSSLLRNYVSAGWLGRKTNRGFYIYSAGKQDRPSGRPGPLEVV